MAASDIWFSNSSSSMSESAAASAGSFSPSGAAAGAGRNGVGAGGAAGGAICAGAAAAAVAAPLPSAAASGWAAGPGGGRGERLAVGAEGGREQRVHVVLGVGAGVGRFEIDDVAKEDLSLVEFVAPDDDGLERQRAFAEARDHRLAAGLDAFRNRDFALARQQLNGAHLAQIHADGIVGALAGLGFLDLGDGLLRDLDQFVVGLVLGLFLVLFLGVGILGLGDVDAHL